MNKSIIEKLGIEPLGKYYRDPEEDGPEKWLFDENQIRDLENQRNEMLEAIIDVLSGNCSIEEIYTRFKRLEEVVENATEMNWSSIKEAISE